MNPADADRNLLVGLLALQLNLATRDQLVAATLAWNRDPTRSLVERLQSAGALAPAETSALIALAELQLARRQGDVRQSLASLAPHETLAALRGATDERAVRDALDTCLPLADAAATLGPEARGPEARGPEARGGEAPAPDTRAPHVRAPATRVPDVAPQRDVYATQSPDATETPRHPHAATVAMPARSGGKTPAASGDAAGPLSVPAAQRFRILRPFQRGGLGQVSIARDGELNRDVALKEILPRHADSPEARQRFLMEAEITGSLEHPGVAPVYGLGQYSDGRPFYAMRFIRGDNLQLAIQAFHGLGSSADRELRFRKLLGSLVAVCQVMEYAHARCVVHRDLKPGNIMLGKYGETIVVDWGLAKTLEPGAAAADTVELPVPPLLTGSTAATHMGAIVGTPAYMSPEQATGRVDQVGPASDIYSLGATLYHILTGQSPLSGGDDRNALDRVRRGDFPPPRQIKPEIPRPLEAICLRAMALEPRDRYASARGLADDVERFLADEPVAAYAEPWPLRLTRWMRKHRPLVYSAGAVLVVAAGALTLGVLLLGAANRREQAQRLLAEQNFAMARDAVRDYYISVSEDTLLNQEGMQPLRDRLLRQALAYYQQFLASEPDEEPVRDELAQANLYVGSITEAIDSPAKAIPFYRQASQLYGRPSIGSGAAPPGRREGLGRALNALGGALQKLQRYEESLANYRQAEQVRRELAEAAPENVEYARTLANTIMNQGTIGVSQGDVERGLELWNRAQEIRLAKLNPADPEHRRLLRDVGLGEFNLGQFELDAQNEAAAERHLRQAIEAFERVKQDAPNDLDSQYRLALAYRALGDLQSVSEGLTRARGYYDRALELLRQLSVRNPEVPTYRSDLGSIQLMAADLSLQAGEAAEALAAADRAVPLLEQLGRDFPDVPLYARNLAVARRLRGAARLATASSPPQRAAAAEELAAAAASLERLMRLEPDDDDLAEQWALARAAADAAAQAAAPEATPPEATPLADAPPTDTPTEPPPSRSPPAEPQPAER